MTLTSVVLPAPLGPMRPWIDPCSTSSDTPSTAWTPPKWRLTSSRRSSTYPRSWPPRRADQRKSPAADDALRSEDDDGDQEDAAQDVDVVARLSKDLGEQGDDQRTDHRAQDVAAAPEDGERKNLHGPCHAVLGIARVDEEIEVRLERSGVAGDHSAEDERDHLVARDVDALPERRDLVLPDGGPGVSKAPLGQPPHQEDDHDQRGEDHRHTAERVGVGVLETKPFAGDWHIEDDAEAQRLDEADRGDREKHTAQAQHRQPDEETEHAREQDAGRDVQRQRGVP